MNKKFTEIIIIVLAIFLFFFSGQKEIMADSDPKIILPNGEDQSIEFGIDYSYQVITSGFNDNIQFILEESPLNAEINNSGLVSWSPSPDSYSENPHSFKVKVFDQSSNSKTVEWKVGISTPLEVITESQDNLWASGHEYKSYRIYYNKAEDVRLLPRKIEVLNLQGEEIFLEDLRTNKGSNYYEIIFTPTTEEIHKIILTIRGKSNRYESEVIPQVFSFNLDAKNNENPKFYNFTPPLESQVNKNYRFSPQASNEDYQSLKFSLLEFPQGASIDQENGTISWDPGEEALLKSSTKFTLLVEDNFNGSDKISWEVKTLDAFEDDNSPQLASESICSIVFRNNETLNEQIYQFEKNYLAHCGFRSIHNSSDRDFIKISLKEENNQTISIWIPFLDSEDNNLKSLQYTLFSKDLKPITSKIEYRDDGIYAILEPGEYFLEIYGKDREVYRPILFYNLRPTLTLDISSNFEIEENSEINFTLLFEDPNQDSFYYSLSEDSKKDGMKIDRLTGQFSWKPTFEDQGSYSLKINILEEDTKLLPNEPSSIFEYFIKVNNINRSPFFHQILNQESYQGNMFKYKAEAMDPDKDSLSYSLTSAPEGAVIDFISGVITWKNSILGNHIFTVNAQDPEGSLDSTSFTLKVKKIFQKVIDNDVQDNGSTDTNDPNSNSTKIPLVEEAKNALVKGAQAAGISSDRTIEADPEEENTDTENISSEENDKNESDKVSLSNISQDKPSSNNSWIIVAILAVVGAAGYLAFYFTRPA